MNKKNVLFSLILGFAVLALTVISCKKEEAAAPLKLVSLMAGDIDLNGAASSNIVPTNPTIIATFNTDVDTSTVNAANIILNQDYNDTNIELNFAVSGKTITITTIQPLGNGALFELSFGAGLMSTANLAITAVARTFTTIGAFVPSGVIAYWNFEDNADDQVGSWNPKTDGIVDITYAASRKTAAGKAAEFNGTTSIIEYANGDALMNTPDFTLSFWAKALDQLPKGHFIIGLGAFWGFQFELNANFKDFKMPVQFEYGDGTTGTGGDLLYNGDGKTKDNGGYVGTTFSKENTTLDAVLKEKWFHITYVYNSATKERSLFLNGELVKTQDHDLFAVLGKPAKEATIVGLKYGGKGPDVINELAFGFVQSRGGKMWAGEAWGGYKLPGANHFKGQLDDVRIFHKALTETEIGLMYASEKP